MTILSTLGRIVTEFGAARSRYLTERAISALPTEVQKDIGWPDVSSEALMLRASAAGPAQNDGTSSRLKARRDVSGGLFCCHGRRLPAMQWTHDAYEQAA